jgi:hypothetical protein
MRRGEIGVCFEVEARKRCLDPFDDAGAAALGAEPVQELPNGHLDRRIAVG